MQKKRKKFKVTLLPSQKVIDVFEGETLLHAAKRQGVLIKSSCGGVANCRTCVVKVISGEQHLSAVEFEEAQLIGNVFHVTRERLSCQIKVSGDVSVDLSAHQDATLHDVGTKTLK